MTISKYIEEPVAEADSVQITAYLEQETEEYVPLAALSSLTLTLRDKASGGIVNSRNNQSILNANGGTVSEVVENTVTRTKLVLQLTPADHPVVDATRRVESRVALIRWTWNGGARGGGREILYKVTNLMGVP
jgi:hypothetical protein